MDRERKLLFTVAVLAPIIEGLMFATYHQPELSARTEAAVADANACHQQLLKAWAQCGPKDFHRKNV